MPINPLEYPTTVVPELKKPNLRDIYVLITNQQNGTGTVFIYGGKPEQLKQLNAWAKEDQFDIIFKDAIYARDEPMPIFNHENMIKRMPHSVRMKDIDSKPKYRNPYAK